MVDDPLVQVGAVGVGLVPLRLFGGVDRYGNRLRPVTGGHQVVGEVVLAEIGLLAKPVGSAGVQPFPLGRDQVIVDGFSGQRMTEAIAARSFFVHQLVLNETGERIQHRLFGLPRDTDEHPVVEGPPQHRGGPQDLRLGGGHALDAEQDRLFDGRR